MAVRDVLTAAEVAIYDELGIALSEPASPVVEPAAGGNDGERPTAFNPGMTHASNRSGEPAPARTFSTLQRVGVAQSTSRWTALAGG